MKPSTPIMASFICELILNIYGFYQNTSDVIVMKNKRFEKSTSYKFLILCGIFNIINYLLKIIIMAWLLINLKEDSCYYFGIGLIFTEFSTMGSLFGISMLRFISVVKKNVFIKLDQLEDILWKFLFPIFLAIASTLTTFKSAANDWLQQVRI